MRFYWLPIVLVFATTSLRSSTINVTGDTFALLQTGDELLVQFNIQNYEFNARRYGAPALPQKRGSTLCDGTIHFRGPIRGQPSFNERVDCAAVRGTLEFLARGLSRLGVSGSGIDSHREHGLSSQTASALFPGANATLDLRNLGGDVQLGLPPYTLAQDFNLSLDGGPISVGARITSVKLARASSSPVPEPNSGPLMVGGGAILCLLARLLGRSTKV